MMWSKLNCQQTADPMSLTEPEPRPDHRDPSQPQGPVQWFGLKTLYTSAKEDSAATQFARLADARQSQAAVSPAYVFDLSGAAEGAFLMDYVADTGDGYDATFAIARSTDGSINPDNGDDVDASGAPSDRAHLVMLGGDEVYPVASVKEYKNRLSRPFADSVRPTTGKGFLAAIPGNHDWYDGLNAFRRNFCESFLKRIDQSGPPAEFMQTPEQGAGDEYLDRTLFQTRSYFSVKLPHGGGFGAWTANSTPTLMWPSSILQTSSRVDPGPRAGDHRFPLTFLDGPPRPR